MRRCVEILGTWIGGLAWACILAAPLAAWGDELPADGLPTVDAAPADTYPSMSGELWIEIQNDRMYHAQDRDRELNDLYATIEPAISFAFTESFSIESALVFEPVEDPDPHESREFSQQGLFVEEIYALWTSGNLSLRAGKINPRFGKAWDLAPGLYGVDFAEDYELTERVGAGASYDLGNADTGSHVLSFETFFADTSHLTRSVFRGRSRVRRDDGGPSNTGRLNSYSVTLEGEAIPAIEGLTYNLGLVYQADGGDGRPESDYVAGATYAFSVTDTLDLEFLAEYVLQDNADGEADRARRYLTGSAAALYNDLTVALSYTLRDESIRAARDNNDFLFQVSVGYFREVGIGQAGFEAGYRLTREENQKVGTAGLRASYLVPF